MSESPDNWQRFGEWVLERRQSLGLSQEQAADLAGIHRQQWYRIEKGASTKRSTVLNIATVLNTNPDDALAVAYGLSDTIEPVATTRPDDAGDLMRIYLSLPPDRQRYILIIAKAFARPELLTDQTVVDHHAGKIPRAKAVDIDEQD